MGGNLSRSKWSLSDLESLKIDLKKSKIEATLRAFSIKDGEFELLYIPSLSITSYGKDLAEAEDLLTGIMDDYFDTLLSLKESDLSKELSKYGWNKTIYKRQFRNDVHIDAQGVLRNLELPADTHIEEKVLAV